MEISQKDNIVFKNFFKLKEEERFHEALEILDSLKQKYKQDSSIFGLYGSIFYELEDFKNSAINFEKVLLIKPKSELASLGLFHSLIHLKKPRKALNELYRFTDIAKPKLHIETIKFLMKTIDTIEVDRDKKKIKNLYMKWCPTPS